VTDDGDPNLFDEQVVTINVTKVNVAPLAIDNTYTTVEDSITSGNVLTDNTGAGIDNDMDDDSLTASLVSDVTNGTLLLNTDGSFSYTPDANFNGQDSFTYKTNDGLLDSNTATVNITVTPVNDAPTIAAGQNFSVAENAVIGTKVGKLVANDPDGDSLTYSIVAPGTVNAFSSSSGENVSILAVTSADGSKVFSINSSTGQITVAGPLDFESVSVYTLTVEVSDGTTSSQATITINVTNVDEAVAVAVDDTATTQGDPVQIGVLNNDQNVAGGSAQIIRFTQPAHGRVTLNADNTFTYVPNTGFSGIDTFSYTIQDLNGNETTASVSVTVEDQLPSFSLGDNTQTSTGYTGSTTTGSGGYYSDTSYSADHGSNDLEYVREAVTDRDSLLDSIKGPNRSSSEGDLPGEIIDLATVDPTVILEAPAAGEGTEAAQELSESLQQEAERFEQDRKQLIDTLEEVSDLLRCG